MKHMQQMCLAHARERYWFASGWNPRSAVLLLLTAVAAVGVPALAQDLAPAGGTATVGGAVNIEYLTSESPLIVRGVVAGSESKWVGRVIYTHYQLVVQETLKGEARSSVTLAVPGGSLGNVQLVIPGAPTLVTGQELVVFGEPVDDQPEFRAVGTFDGIVPVTLAKGDTAATAAPGGKPEELSGFLERVRKLIRSRSGSGRQGR